MLDVAYEAVADLPPGRLARIDEDRGRVRVLVDKNADLVDVVRQLNIEVDRFLSTSHWFQLWKDEIVSRDTPDQPLRVEYIFDVRAPGVGMYEDRGIMHIYIHPDLDTEQFVAVMNPATKQQLSGGHWFQLYGGEIIDNGPEQPMTRV